MSNHNPADYNTDYFPTWCPGCGDWAIWASLKSALSELELDPHRTVIVFGIGCSGNMANTVKVYGFHGLHGRSIPVAAGVKLANHDMKVIVIAGDGDCYGEGLSHFIHGARANHDITVIVHDNQIYGLTTGQTSPTSSTGTKTKSTPAGVLETQLKPLALAITAGATFVARGFAGDQPHLTELMKKAIAHNGFSTMDIYQPCVTFNRTNTYDWFRERIVKLEKTRYKTNDRIKAIKKLHEEEGLPIGVFYQQEGQAYHEGVDVLRTGVLAGRDISGRDLEPLIHGYI